jgi:hypothetical protein
MKIEKRLPDLESKLHGKSTVLHFADHTEELPKRLLNQLLFAVLRRRVTPQQAEVLKRIRCCIGAIEPGGSHLVELIRVMWSPEPWEPNEELDRCDGV